MTYDRKRFDLMKEQLPQWLLDSQHPDCQANITAFLAFGPDAEKELNLQRKLLGLIRNEIGGESIKAPDQFFAELSDNLWKDLQADKRKSNNERLTAGVENGVKNVVQLGGRKRKTNTNTNLLLSIFAIAASIIFVVILLPNNSGSTDVNLSEFHQQLSKPVLIPSIAELDIQQRLGFAPPGEISHIAEWGVRLTYLYALLARNENDELALHFDSLCQFSGYQQGTVEAVDEKALAALTDWLEKITKKDGLSAVLHAGIWVTNLQLATSKGELMIISDHLQPLYNNLPVSVKTDTLEKAWQELMFSLSASLSSSLDPKNKKIIDQHARELIVLFKL